MFIEIKDNATRGYNPTLINVNTIKQVKIFSHLHEVTIGEPSEEDKILYVITIVLDDDKKVHLDPLTKEEINDGYKEFKKMLESATGVPIASNFKIKGRT
jgi:hypothetical protein